MIISTIYAINLNHYSEFIHPEFTALCAVKGLGIKETLAKASSMLKYF